MVVRHNHQLKQPGDDVKRLLDEVEIDECEIVWQTLKTNRLRIWRSRNGRQGQEWLGSRSKAAVAKSVAEARPSEIAKHSATSTDEAGSSGSRAVG